MKMKNPVVLLAAAVLFLGLGFAPLYAQSASTPPGQARNLNPDWKFSKAKGEIFPLADAMKGMEKNGKKFYEPEYDDSDWGTVSVPHAVNAEDSFDSLISDAGEVDLYRGFMFYRKHMTLENVSGKKIFLEFESVRQSIYLYVNGTYIGAYEAGVAPAGFDISAAVKTGDNLIAVASDNTASRQAQFVMSETIPGHTPGDNSGIGYQWNQKDFNPVQGGITGNVNLYVKSSTYLTLPLYNNLKTTGTCISAVNFDFSKNTATINVRAEVRNESQAAADVFLRTTIADVKGEKIASFDSVSSTAAKAKDAGKIFPSAVESDAYSKKPRPTDVITPDVSYLSSSKRVSNLKFWSPEAPSLYTVTVSLMSKKGKVLDSQKIVTGFRKVEYDLGKGGLLINDKPYYLKGYAQRSTNEWAVIGVANDWLNDFDASLIRESGANFIRWMHVLPKPAPIRSGDKFGIVAVCPAGDKEKDIEGRAWNQRVEAMRDAIIYFRNSPSILFWEAGNNAITPEHMKEMTALRKKLDPTGGRFMGCRTITSPEQIAAAEWVGTMIYRHDAAAFKSMQALSRFLPIVETEYKRDESPRRIWDDFTPPYFDYINKWLGPNGKKKDGYDVWDQTQEDFCRLAADRRDGYFYFYNNRVGGKGKNYYSAAAMMVWSDSNMHGRNAGSENCRTTGRVDPVRIKKESFYALQVFQSETPKLKILGHWNYPQLTSENYKSQFKTYDGTFFKPNGGIEQRDPKNKQVFVVAAKCDRVDLIVNKRQPIQCNTGDGIIFDASIDVTQSGFIEAIGYKNDKEVARDKISTAGEAAAIRLTPVTGPDGLLADGSDLAFFEVEIVDKNGMVCPTDTRRIDFTLSGPAKFLGGYNSGRFGKDSVIHKSFVFAECGVNRVFVRAGRTAGKITLKAEAGGIVTAGAQTPILTASASIASKTAVVQGGFLSEPQQAFPLDACKPSVYRPCRDDVQEDGSADEEQAEAEQPFTVRVNQKNVIFQSDPFQPDSSTGVVCAIRPVLDALIEAGVNIKYTVLTKGDAPISQLSAGAFPVIVITAGSKTIYAANGETELFLNNGTEKNLTNYQFIEQDGELIGEINAILAYIPVKTAMDIDGRNLDITLKMP